MLEILTVSNAYTRKLFFIKRLLFYFTKYKTHVKVEMFIEFINISIWTGTFGPTTARPLGMRRSGAMATRSHSSHVIQNVLEIRGTPIGLFQCEWRIPAEPTRHWILLRHRARRSCRIRTQRRRTLSLDDIRVRDLKLVGCYGRQPIAAGGLQ